MEALKFQYPFIYYNFKSQIIRIKEKGKSKATKAILELKAKPMK